MSNNYPMSKLEIRQNEQEEPLLWVVDVWQSDDYRMQDAFFFVCQDEAIEFAKWTVETDQSMRWPQNSIYPIRPYQIKTLEENKKRFIDFYGDSESDE